MIIQSSNAVLAAVLSADHLLDREFALQSAMWSTGREDNAKGEMTDAAVCSLMLVHSKNARDRLDMSDPDVQGLGVMSDEELVAYVRELMYPEGWSGFRDYGSDVANLVVAGAYIKSEIARRLLLGQDTTRADRKPEQKYTKAQPKFTTADPDWKSKIGE